ncbi:DNA adenine methylase [Pedobacter alluvionis]|uniref:site-specific DNA-methyltransferase (adenine-specific) n=1 Tax=Pedobacter alluvionis TaxID=475253 RepID=A0A497Y3Q1_9SPHI|nr:DNA adenine methylase [Pedobacter alluvionis]RLJ77134.1 adenine-specific DNA-methyltransferase [Pedobacter alluvionis]TFB33628.1 DNA methyltransferase [Pedobacter alluvionis]
MILTDTIDFKKLPTTRYSGSKRKILPWIFNNVKNINFHTALDGFGGTGSVSYLMKKMGKSVTYNDKLKFNHFIGKALIENDSYKILDEEIKTLFHPLGNIGLSNFTVTKNFEDIYFLKEENEQIDVIVHNINNIFNEPKEENSFKKAIAYYALFQSTLSKRPYNLFHRKNLNMRTADVKRNFGNKTTWETSLEELMIKFTNEANNNIFKSDFRALAINKSIFDIDEYGYDLVYLDPPYISKKGSNESSNYLKCYHFLEGLANYKDWEDLIDYSKKNRPLVAVNEVNEFVQATIHEDLEKILYKFRKSIIVLSYKSGGIPSINYLFELIEKIKGNAHIVTLPYKYALTRKENGSELNEEVLIIGL